MRRLLAEWEPQAATLIAWPHEDTDWRSRLPEAERSYRQLVGAISRHQDVLICCRDGDHEQHVRGCLEGHAASERCRFYALPYDDTWCRDYGPISLQNNGRTELVRFRFNGWGNRFGAGRDAAAAARLHKLGAFGDHPLIEYPQVLEGGAIDNDGRGTVITTARCLLSDNRNGAVDRGDVERLLHHALAAERVLWLDHGEIAGDDTDGHVDMLARFCDPHTLVYSEDSSVAMRAMEKQLRSFRQTDGSRYRLVPLPLPEVATDGQPVPASYTNFLITNGAVILPVYNRPEDSIAAERLRYCFPDREIVALDARTLVSQGGAFHCAAMQLYS